MSVERSPTVVQLLIEAGIKVDARNCDNETSLRKAIFWGHTSMGLKLLENGADVNAQDCIQHVCREKCTV